GPEGWQESGASAQTAAREVGAEENRGRGERAQRRHHAAVSAPLVGVRGGRHDAVGSRRDRDSLRALRGRDGLAVRGEWLLLLRDVRDGDGRLVRGGLGLRL